MSTKKKLTEEEKKLRREFVKGSMLGNYIVRIVMEQHFNFEGTTKQQHYVAKQIIREAMARWETDEFHSYIRKIM